MFNVHRGQKKKDATMKTAVYGISWKLIWC